MKLKVGDKVKFLNENGGGVVSKILSSSMVNVAIEDGFDIPVMTTDLVKIQTEEDQSKQFFSENFDVDLEKHAEASSQSEVETFNRESPIRYALTQSKGDTGVYLAYVPQQQQWMVTGLLDVYLYNNTEDELMYSMNLKTQEGVWISADKGMMKPKTFVLIASIEREDLEGWSQGVVQVMFTRNESKELVLPGHYAFKIKPSRFFKEDAYKPNFLMNDKAILQMLSGKADMAVHSEAEIDLKEENNQAVKMKAKVVKPKELIDKHKIGEKEAEVDLHISALKDDYNKMKAHEIFNYQMGYFEKALDNALVNQYKRVIFIHGIGNGTLRDEIRKVLKEYDEVNVRNASFQQYGTGALEVTIHSK
jgi:hypothetical protein